ncbi:proteasome activator pa28 REG alpha/beta subunit [Cristinia sonorae]|uniref:Proteasome activator pa28 REG alpha/beta subunit n=1 Tax=Cristinia sonorae TaxID=1940300 RepID=A0A8K0XNR8_9AGAR|nr:proteasome activator pa28 REG alpha/beta subunit [Cristinia sonorae]
MTTKMDQTTTDQLEVLRNSTRVAAEEVIFRRFPEKRPSELNLLVDSTSQPASLFHRSLVPSFTDATVHPPSEEQELKKRKLDSIQVNGLTESHGPLYTGRVLHNSHLKNVHEVIKRECEELQELCDKVIRWITFNMPKKEDGDNFGVEIQEEALNELQRSQEAAYGIRDTARTHSLERAKICAKLLKYPNLEDYTLALQEHDEKQLYISRRYLIDLIHMYTVITDTIHKNIDKIRSPKGNNSIGLY